MAHDVGIRTVLLTSYDRGKAFYSEGLVARNARKSQSAVRWANELGVMLWYGAKFNTHRGRIKSRPMNIEEMVEKWHKLVVGLAVAHDKDEADRLEAAVEACLTPILAAPVKQLREFAVLVRDSLKNDPSVPYLIWHGFEVWVDKIVTTASDEDVKELKTQLAAEIVEMVEEDAKRDLPAAMIRALQWRSPEQLENVKEVVETEKKAGRKVRLRGRESCLFLEAGGTEDEPKVCVQV